MAKTFAEQTTQEMWDNLAVESIQECMRSVGYWMNETGITDEQRKSLFELERQAQQLQQWIVFNDPPKEG